MTLLNNIVQTQMVVQINSISAQMFMTLFCQNNKC